MKPLAQDLRGETHLWCRWCRGGNGDGIRRPWRDRGTWSRLRHRCRYVSTGGRHSAEQQPDHHECPDVGVWHGVGSSIRHSRMACRRRRHCLRHHLVAERGAATTFLRTVPAQSMVRSMLFAQPGAEFADLRAERADSEGECGLPSHPLGGQEADVRTVATEPDTANHQVVRAFMRHADHVVRACIT